MVEGQRCMDISLINLLLLTVSGVVANDDRASKIDEYIESLEYDRTKILDYQGERVKGSPRQGTLDASNNFIVIEKEGQKYHSNTPDIGIITSSEHRTFPGNLLLANERLVGNSPDELAVHRAPLTYTINLPGLTTDGSFKIEPSFQAYQAAVNHVVDTWFEKHKEDNHVNANFQSVHSLAYSKELLRVKFGLEFKQSAIESSIDFNMMSSQKKLIMIHKFKQIFYTVSVESVERPSDLFGPDVTVEIVKKKTNSRNPPVMVDSVSYGRTIYVKVETSSTDRNAKFALTNKLSPLNIGQNADAEFSKTLKDLSITVFVIGGSSKTIDLVRDDKLKELNEVIADHSNFSRENRAYPVSYSTVFVKDNSRAAVNLYTEYVESTRYVSQSGRIKLSQQAWYSVTWNVSWTEIEFDETGEKVETFKEWDRNGEYIRFIFSEEIQLPGNAEDIRVLARRVPLHNKPHWRRIIDLTGIPLIEFREFIVRGTAIKPKYDVKPPL